MAKIIKLVTLDVTNTLLRIVRSPGYHYKSVGEIYGIKASENELNVVWKEKYKEYCQKYPNFGAAVDMTDYKWWTDLIKECFLSLNATSEVETLNQIANHLYLHFSTGKPWEKIPNSEEALQKIRNSGVKVGVISNFDQRLQKILESTALEHYFDFILTSYSAGIEKPNTGIFHKASEIACVEPAYTIHVGDDYVKDFLGASSAGFEAYLLVRDGSNSKKDVEKQFIIKDLVDLYEKIKTRLPSQKDSLGNH